MLLLIFATFLLSLTWLYFKQESLLFFPEPLAANHHFELKDVTEETIAVDGATLSALHYRQPPELGAAKGVIFFLHGNGGNLQNWLTSTEFYRRTGYDVFMMDYRGYGKSTGKISSEAQLHADVLAAWRHVEKEYAGRKNVIYGRSLGTGLAAKLVTELVTELESTQPPHAPSLLVLVSPYASLLQIGKELYPWVPGVVMRYPMRSDLWLPQVRIPTLIVHGARDELIPVSHARQLQAIRPATELVILPEGTHNDMHMHAEYVETLAEHLRKL